MLKRFVSWLKSYEKPLDEDCNLYEILEEVLGKVMESNLAIGSVECRNDKHTVGKHYIKGALNYDNHFIVKAYYSSGVNHKYIRLSTLKNDEVRKVLQNIIDEIA